MFIALVYIILLFILLFIIYNRLFKGIYIDYNTIKFFKDKIFYCDINKKVLFIIYNIYNNFNKYIFK